MKTQTFIASLGIVHGWASEHKNKDKALKNGIDWTNTEHTAEHCMQ